MERSTARVQHDKPQGRIGRNSVRRGGSVALTADCISGRRGDAADDAKPPPSNCETSARSTNFAQQHLSRTSAVPPDRTRHVGTFPPVRFSRKRFASQARSTVRHRLFPRNLQDCKFRASSECARRAVCFARMEMALGRMRRAEEEPLRRGWRIEVEVG